MIGNQNTNDLGLLESIRFTLSPIFCGNLTHFGAMLILVLAGLGQCLRAEAAAVAQTQVIERKTENKTNEIPTLQIVFIGDSLTEGFGVKLEDAYPAVVGRLLNEKGLRNKIVNGGISGSLSAEAERRVKWFRKQKPDLIVLALGANDGLKGTDPDLIKTHLGLALAEAKAAEIPVLLCGMKVFVNFGPAYQKKFSNLYADLAKQYRSLFLPFLLEGVALKKELNLPDMKHPNEAGHQIIAKMVANQIEIWQKGPTLKERKK